MGAPNPTYHEPSEVPGNRAHKVPGSPCHLCTPRALEVHANSTHHEPFGSPPTLPSEYMPTLFPMSPGGWYQLYLCSLEGPANSWTMSPVCSLPSVPMMSPQVQTDFTHMSPQEPCKFCPHELWSSLATQPTINPVGSIPTLPKMSPRGLQQLYPP